MVSKYKTLIYTVLYLMLLVAAIFTGKVLEVAVLIFLSEISIKLSSIKKQLKKQTRLMEEEEVMFLEEDACDGDCLNCMCSESK
jgi:hypothetical protein